MPDYEQMLASQGRKCAICDQPELTVIRGKTITLAVDHDHATGAVRALLCRRCNHMIGMACDDPALLRAAATYLEAHAEPPEVIVTSGVSSSGLVIEKLEEINGRVIATLSLPG